MAQPNHLWGKTLKQKYMGAEIHTFLNILSNLNHSHPMNGRQSLLDGAFAKNTLIGALGLGPLSQSSMTWFSIGILKHLICRPLTLVEENLHVSDIFNKDG